MAPKRTTTKRKPTPAASKRPQGAAVNRNNTSRTRATGITTRARRDESADRIDLQNPNHARDVRHILRNLRGLHNVIIDLTIGGCPCIKRSKVKSKPIAFPRDEHVHALERVGRSIQVIQALVHERSEQDIGTESCKCLHQESDPIDKTGTQQSSSPRRSPRTSPTGDNAAQKPDGTTKPNGTVEPNGSTKPDGTAKPSRQRPSGAFEYPKLPEVLDASNACATLKKLLRYWNMHYAADSGKFAALHGISWLEIPHTRAAITSVTEAINRDGSESFCLWSETAFALWAVWHQEDEPTDVVAPTEQEMYGRGIGRWGQQNRLIIPVWLSPEKRTADDEDNNEWWPEVYLTQNRKASADGHTVAVEFYYEGGQARARVYDSYPGFLRQDARTIGDAEAQLRRGIRNLATSIGWTDLEEENVDVGFHAAQQMPHSDSCSMHAIFNAWTRAMNLTPNIEFRPTTAFYTQAQHLVNLAYAGFMDSATLYAFLVCTKFVPRDISYTAAGRHFSDSWAVTNPANAFEFARQRAVRLAPDPTALSARRRSQDSVGSSSEGELRTTQNDLVEQRHHLAQVINHLLSEADYQTLLDTIATGEFQQLVQRRHRIRMHNERKAARLKANPPRASP